MTDGMLVIDDHCHFGQPRSSAPGSAASLADELLARMDGNGIDQTVLCHLIFPLWEQEDFTRGTTWFSTRPESTRIGWWACASSIRSTAGLPSERRDGVSRPGRGIKYHPVLNGFYPSAGRL